MVVEARADNEHARPQRDGLAKVVKGRGGVAVHAFNEPRWFFAAVGALAAGWTISGVYLTNTYEQSKHILVDYKPNPDYLYALSWEPLVEYALLRAVDLGVGAA